MTRPRTLLALFGITAVIAGCNLFADPFETGEKALRSGNYSRAIEAYTKAVAEGKFLPVAYANRCYAYQAAGNYGAAIRDCTEALDLLGEPDEDDKAAASEYAQALNNRAVASIGMRRYDDAIEDLDRAIELVPEYAEAYANRGRALVELEEYDKAIVDLEEATHLAPKLAEAYGNWAQALTGLGKPDEALEMFGQAIEVSGNPDIHFNRASLLYAIGRFEEALKDYRVVAERSQNGQLKWMAQQQVIFLSHLPTGTPGAQRTQTAEAASRLGTDTPEARSSESATPEAEQTGTLGSDEAGANRREGTGTAESEATATPPARGASNRATSTRTATSTP